MSDPPTLPLDPRSLIDIPVRPEADAFPMLDGEAFADLGAGIRDHGQMEPIELDTDGAIGDGRNRYAACRWLGIEPRTVTLAAETDWVARVVEKNLNRRHATKGARAVALARLAGYSVSSSRALEALAGINHAYVSRARFVVAHAADLATQVEAGGSLNAAYDLAVERERLRTTAEEDAEKHLAYVQEQQRKALEKLEAARAGIGAPVTVPPEPDLAVAFTHQPSGEVKLPDSERGLGDNLDREAALLRRLGAIKADVARVAAEDIIDDAWFFEGHVLAVRSWASQVVALVYDMVEAHNAALRDEGALRRVK